MSVNAVLGIQDIETTQSIVTNHHSPITRTMRVKSNIGVLLCGLLMAMNKNKELVPYETLQTTIGTGNGSETSFGANISNNDPMLPGSVKIIAGDVILVDDGCGNLFALDDDSQGTINYMIGDCNIDFDTPPGDGVDVIAVADRKLMGVLSERCDSSKEDACIIVVHGTVWSDRLLKKEHGGDNFVPIAETDKSHLSNIGVYPI